MVANTAPRTAAAPRRRRRKALRASATIGLSVAAIAGLSFVSSGASAETNVLEETVVQIVSTDSTATVDLPGESSEAAAEAQEQASGQTEPVTADSEDQTAKADDLSLRAVIEIAEETVEENIDTVAADSAPAEGHAGHQAPAQTPAAQKAAHRDTQPAAQAPAAAAPAQTHWNVDVACAGDQAAIDGCVGATNYLPASKALGVPYYAQHDYLGGNSWWAIQPGHAVSAEGATYVARDVRVVETGGSSEQIEDMRADAFLQTCLEDGVHSRVVALVRQ